MDSGTELKEIPEQSTNSGDMKPMNGETETTIQIDGGEEMELFTIMEKTNRNYTLRVKFEHEAYYAGENIRGMVELISENSIDSKTLPSIVIVFKVYSVIKIRGLIKDKSSIHYEVLRRYVPKAPVEMKLFSITKNLYASQVQLLTTLPTCMPVQGKGECGPKGESEYDIKYTVNCYLREQPSFLNLASILGRMTLKSKLNIYPTPLYPMFQDGRNLKITHTDQSQSPYRFKATFFKNVYKVGEEVMFRISFRSDIKPYITNVVTSLESIISLFGLNNKGEQKCVQRYEEKPDILHSFDVEMETREKSEEEYEVTFSLSDSLFPSVLDSNDWVIKRDYSISVRAECGEAEGGPIVYHDIFISAPTPEEVNRQKVPEKEIKAFETVLKEEKFEADGRDFLN